MKKHLLFVLSTLLFLFASTFSVHAQAKLWGMTSGGGSQNLGTIFNVDEDGTNYSHTSLVDFSKGSSPQGSLVQAGNGKLYGMTINGGLIDDQGSYGVIFEFDPTTNTYTKKFHFDSNFTPDLSNTTGSL